MNITQKEYKERNKKASPPSPVIKDCIMAFIFGGGICTMGEAFYHYYLGFGLGEKYSRAAVSITLIFIAAVLTMLKVFDNIAKVAGAGTLVPITGFSNAVVSPAIEFKSEGFILGVGAKMFIIAGPVIVYGVSASVIYGFIYWLIKMITP